MVELLSEAEIIETLAPQYVSVEVGDGLGGEVSDHYVIRTPWPFAISVPLHGNNDGYGEISLVSACCHSNLHRVNPMKESLFSCYACDGYLGSLSRSYFSADVTRDGVVFLKPKHLEALLEDFMHPFSVVFATNSLAELIQTLTRTTLTHRVKGLSAHRRYMGKLARWFGSVELLSATIKEPSVEEIGSMGGSVRSEA